MGLLAVCLSLSAQNLTVSGFVTDKNGALPGVAIWLQGSASVYTMSSMPYGAYFLPNVPPGGTLEYDMIGYDHHSEAVSGRTMINVIMVENGDMPIITPSSIYAGIRFPSVMDNRKRVAENAIENR